MPFRRWLRELDLNQGYEPANTCAAAASEEGAHLRTKASPHQ
jgi:hypothetical protein